MTSATKQYDELLKAITKANIKDSLEVMCEYMCEGLENIEATYPAAAELLDQIEAATAAPKPPVKEFFARIVADVYSDPVLLKAFVASLPDRLQKIFAVLLWEGPQTIGMLQNRFGKLMTTDKAFETMRNDWRNYRPEHYLQREMQLFQITKHNSGYYSSHETPDKVARYQATIQPELLHKCKQYLTRPSHKDLTAHDEPPATEFVLQEQEDFNIIAADIFQYLHEGFVEYTTTGKPKKASLRKMREFFAIAEFFPSDDTNWGLQRVELLELLMGQLSASTKFSTADTLKKIVSKMAGDAKSIYHFNTLFLSHIRNHSYYADISTDHIRQASSAVVKAFARLPVGRWVEADEFVRYSVRTDALLPYFAQHILTKGLEFTAKESLVKHTFSSTFQMHQALLTPFLHRPLVFGYAFLFAALGMLDIAYDLPSGWKVEGLPYFTEACMADGLRGIRLTNLGAYLLGITKNYTAPPKKKPAATVELDPERLIAVMSENDNMTSALLGKFGEKITDRHYRISHAKFLEDCTTASDVEHKVALFEERFGSNLPQNWHDFLRSFKSRTDAIVPLAGFIVCSINDDAELLGLLARDPVLKKYVVKVEGRRVAIEKQHWSKVRNRLKELGYFIKG